MTGLFWAVAAAALALDVGSKLWAVRSLEQAVTVLPGVTIGPGCVVGAGSVVTQDIPADSLAAGNPCRVLRPITEADRMASHPERMA